MFLARELGTAEAADHRTLAKLGCMAAWMETWRPRAERVASNVVELEPCICM